MDEFDRLNKLYSYGLYAVAVLTTITAIFLYNGIVLIFSVLFNLLAVIYLNSGHIVNNFLLKKSKVIEVYNGYKVGPELGYATKRRGGVYQGISIATFEPERGMESKNIQIMQLLETIKEPFEFSIFLNEVNKRKLLEPLETKRRMREISLSRHDDRYTKTNKIKREIELMESEINHILNGGSSFEVIIKLKTIALSDSELEAGREASKNLEAVAHKFSATLGVGYEILKGEQILEMLEVS